MRQTDLDWQPCHKHISEYKLTKLPRGDENSSDLFKPVKFEKVISRGPNRKSEEQIKKEQAEAYLKKEQKLVVTDIAI